MKTLNSAIVIQNSISGSGGLTLAGSGYVDFNGLNGALRYNAYTYSGATTISGGTLALSSDAALYSPAEYVGSSGTGTLAQYTGTNSVAGALVLGVNPGDSGTYDLYNGGKLLLSASGISGPLELPPSTYQALYGRDRALVFIAEFESDRQRSDHRRERRKHHSFRQPDGLGGTGHVRYRRLDLDGLQC